MVAMQEEEEENSETKVVLPPIRTALDSEPDFQPAECI